MAQKPKILIVDDDADLLDAMAAFFVDADFQVTMASDGIDATIKVDSERFDAIMTDVNMPRMNGMQFAANVKASHYNASTPLFITSGLTNQDVLQRAVEFGAIRILPKPFNLDNLLISIRETMGHNHNFSSHRPEIAACFAEGVSDILRTYFGGTVTMGIASSPGEVTVNSFTSATVTLFGADSSGFLALCLGQSFMKVASAALFPGIDVKLTDNLICDLAGELANQAAGRVKARLAMIGTDVSIGLPQVVIGLGHKIMRKIGGPILRIEMTAGGQNLSIEFGLKGTKLI